MVTYNEEHSSMNILCLGLNHTTAPLILRERLALEEDGVRIALARLACGHVATLLTELVLISTCNRIELYATSSQLAFTELEVFLSDVSGVPVEQFLPHLYRFQDMDAARHLFEVAAGLDSLVIGEPQILGQVTRALELARGQNTVGAIVNETMQHRAERPLVLIDIAVPRDIDPDVANIPHVKLYDIDNLNAQLEHSLADRMAEVPQVKKILAEELELFREYLKSLDMLPLIADLRQNAEAIR